MRTAPDGLHGLTTRVPKVELGGRLYRIQYADQEDENVGYVLRWQTWEAILEDAARLGATDLLRRPVVQVERDALRDVLELAASELAVSLAHQELLRTTDGEATPYAPSFRGLEEARTAAVLLVVRQGMKAGSWPEILQDLRRRVRIEYLDALVPGFGRIKADHRRRREAGVGLVSYDDGGAPAGEVGGGDWVYDGFTRGGSGRRPRQRRRVEIVGGDASPVEAAVFARLRLAATSRTVWAINLFRSRLGWSLARISTEAGRNPDWAATILSRHRKLVDRNQGESVRCIERAAWLIEVAIQHGYRAPDVCGPLPTDSLRHKTQIISVHTPSEKGDKS